MAATAAHAEARLAACPDPGRAIPSLRRSPAAASRLSNQAPNHGRPRSAKGGRSQARMGRSQVTAGAGAGTGPGAGAGAAAGLGPSLRKPYGPGPMRPLSPLLPTSGARGVSSRTVVSSSGSLPAYRNRGTGVAGVAAPFDRGLPPVEEAVSAGEAGKGEGVGAEAGALGDAFVHEFSLRPDSSQLTQQLLLLKAIQRSTGLCRSATSTATSCMRVEGLPQPDTSPSQPCFQLVPRRLRASAAPLSPDAYSLLTAAQVMKAGAAAVEADWPLELAQLSFPDLGLATVEGGHKDGEALALGGGHASISISSAPASADDLDWLLDASGATALMLLEPEESAELLEVQSDQIFARAAVHGVPVFKIAMGEHNEEKQAEVLPEAVRVLASLLSTGHRVHISCLKGVTCSPLVVLGYLTFFKGLEFGVACEAIKLCCPGASPSYSAWEQAKERMLTGANMQRMTELAQAAYHRRVAIGTRGSLADDWKLAQRKLLMETLTQRVSGDVSMSHSLAQAQVMHVEEVAAEQVKEAEERAAERTRLLARQVEELQRSSSEAAGAAASAAEQIQFFRSQVEELTAREAEARVEVAAAADRVEGLLQELEELRRRERDARAGAAFSVERTEALEEELQNMRERNDSLAQALQVGKEDVAVAEERALQLSTQLQRVKAMEEAARDMAASMQQKAEMLATTVLELEKRAQDSHEHAQSLHGQLVAARQKDEESQKVVAVLQERVSKLGREATAAQDALRAANTRVQFFFRVMNRLMEREKEAQKSAEEASRRLAAAAAEVDGVRKKDVLLTRAWQMAKEKTHLLTLQLDSVELMQAEALVLADQDRLLTSPGPEAELARQMLDEAKARELSLNEQVQELQRQLQEAAEAAEAEEEALKDGEQMVGGAAAAAALEILEQQREVEAKVLRRVGEVAQQNGSLTQELSGAKGDLESSRAEVKELRLQLQAALQAASATEELKGALAVAEAEARAARAAEAQAKERSEFLLRQLQRLKQKMQEDQAAYRRSATAREAALKGEIQTLRERERAAKAAATQAEARAEELQRRMAQLERQQASLQAALGLAQERIAVFFRRAQEQELKEQRSKAALAEARRQVMRLGQQMSGLKSALSKPGPYDAQSSLGLMDDLKRMSLELMHRLRQVEENPQ